MNNKKTAIIADLDGFLINSSERFKRLDLQAFDNKDAEAFRKSVIWYNSDCDGDEAIELGVDLLDWMVTFYNPDKVFFLTARGEGGHNSTLEWLKNEGLWDKKSVLLMHPEDYNNITFQSAEDHACYKRSTAVELMKKYKILYAVDDSETNCQAYISLGIPTLKFSMPIGRVLV